jgi:uncharacterized OB-fold protein
MSADMRPRPLADASTRPYWDAAKAHRLALPRCEACGRWHFYPRSLCPHCGSAAITWAAASGRGTVYSMTQVQRAPSPAFAPAVPYVVALIELEEGPHLMSSIVHCDPATVRIGMPVRVTFLDLDDETTQPVFEPEPESESRGRRR